MRILCISIQVAYGPVGNTAAVPALQATGHEVLALPTITAVQPSGPRSRRMRSACPHDDLAAMLGVLEQMGALSTCGAVMTGYFAVQRSDPWGGPHHPAAEGHE